MSELTGMQRAFVNHWFAENFNGTKAAELAGYCSGGGTPQAWASTASRLLRNVKILKEIERRWAARGVTPSEVVARLTDQMRCSIGDFIDDTGVIDFAKVKKQGHLVKRVVHHKGQRSTIELHDQQRAAELIGKTFALFKERHEHSGKGGGPIPIEHSDAVQVYIPDNGRGDGAPPADGTTGEVSSDTG